MPYVGFGLSLLLLVGLWQARDRFHRFGLDAVAWNSTSGAITVRALVFGAGAGLAVAACFVHSSTGELPRWPEVWVGVAFGPLVEELIFRGYLFRAAEWALADRIAHPGRVSAIVVAAVFALSHLAKGGITTPQLASIFLTGVLFGALRQTSGSTVPPYLAHASYNALIYAAAFLR